MSQAASLPRRWVIKGGKRLLRAIGRFQGRHSLVGTGPFLENAEFSWVPSLEGRWEEIRAELGRYPVKTRLSLTGTLVVGRDIAHAKIKERLDAGEPMPDYLRDHAIYYAGPAKTPDGYASGVLAGPA